MKGGIVAVLAILAVVSLLVQQGEAAVSCGQVDVALVPCVNYLTKRELSPPPACCAGVRTVKGLAQTSADKRAACQCVKNAASSHADLDDAAAQSLPTKCGVSLDIPVSRTVDCSKIA